MNKKFIVMLTLVLAFCGLPLLVGAEDIYDGEVYIMMFDDNPEPGPSLLIGRRARGYDGGGELPVLYRDQLLLISGEGWDGDYYSQQSASIIFRATEDFAPGATGGEIRFRTTENGTDRARDRMRITHNGYVGIGTTAPAGKLETSGEGTIVANFISAYGDPISNEPIAPSFVGRRARGSATSPSAVLTNDVLGFFGGKGYYGYDFPELATAGITISASENHDATSRGSRILFLTTPNGSTVRSPKAVINADGNVGIGTMAPQSTLQVNGYVQLALTDGAPPEADCDEPSEFGRMLVDPYQSCMYICVADGWKPIKHKTKD